MAGDAPFTNSFRQSLPEIPEEDSATFMYEADPCIPNSVSPEHFVNFGLAPGEHLVQCPYEKSHRILPTRMANHLDRCRTNHKNKLQSRGLSERYINCPWNEHHIIPEVEASYHSAQCGSRYKNTQEELEDIKRYAPKDKIICPPELAQFTEDWGAEPPRHLTYNPMKKVLDEPVFYQPKNLNRTAKTKHREEQRLKFYHLVAGPFWDNYESSISRLEANKMNEKSVNYPLPNQTGRAQAEIPTEGPAIFLNAPFSSGRLNLQLETNRLDDTDTKNWVDGNFKRGGHSARLQRPNEEWK
ncbi:unnamed protein product [Allacma fusca]|uniref:CHHC U11-48K-type domain-containing protein n=1 Tax=Allacma fusca TaxID=39272 RepID=A0A8J2LP15_9HEXA|nr:unnamed protein product [Allacma fusca]